MMKRLPFPRDRDLNFHPNGVHSTANVDAKVNYVRSNMTVFGRYSISPTQILNCQFSRCQRTCAEWRPAGDGAEQDSGGRIAAPTPSTRMWWLMPTRLYATEAGRAGPDVVNFDSLALRVLQIPGQRARPVAGGHPPFQIGGWTNIGTTTPGIHFCFETISIWLR
jgi:hypothetical protein